MPSGIGRYLSRRYIVKRIDESRFVPLDKPAMPLMDAVELAMVRHKDALEYLRDK